MTVTMAIKWRLAAVMADRELNYKELAEMVGMNKVTINRMKNKFELDFNLTPATLEKLCSALSCQPGDLLRWVPEKEIADDQSQEK
ncbi:helix-turn-helix domain-containing protein [Adonisia turfae]|nr:helix-turn-helix domain-containing protein [Adonisia turfae]